MLTILVIFSGCSKESIDTSKFNIVTSFYPMYVATANIVEGVEDVELRIDLGNKASKYVEDNYEQKKLFGYLKMHRDALISGEK